MRRARGFSLIEVLVVVAIILIIAAIAVPSFLRSRMAANESAAAASIRTLNSAQISYNSLIRRWVMRPRWGLWGAQVARRRALRAPA